MLGCATELRRLRGVLCTLLLLGSATRPWCTCSCSCCSKPGQVLLRLRLSTNCKQAFHVSVNDRTRISKVYIWHSPIAAWSAGSQQHQLHVDEHAATSI